MSTSTPFVLVTVINGNTGEQQAVCVEAIKLMSALKNEHGLDWEEAIAFALAQPDRTFKLSKEDALESMARAYDDQVLQEARGFLASMTSEQVEAVARGTESSLYEFLMKEPQPFFRGRFQAVAHVLSERGFLGWAGCKPGVIYFEKE